jgi:hypothetical protein
MNRNAAPAFPSADLHVDKPPGCSFNEDTQLCREVCDGIAGNGGQLRRAMRLLYLKRCVIYCVTQFTFDCCILCWLFKLKRIASSAKLQTVICGALIETSEQLETN